MENRNRSPRALQKGDCIGIMAPAGQIQDTALFEKGLAVLNDMGFHVKFPRSLWPGNGYLSDSDTNRAKEVHTMLADDSVDALLALRGGFGCLRLLPLLDVELLKRTNKPLLGFSDLTLLHTLLAEQCGLVSFHSPMLLNLASSTPAARAQFHASLSGKWEGLLPMHSVEILRGGDTVHGPLKGGNLSSLVSLLGTPYQPNLEGAVLFLEDIGEPLYKLDRMLTQLHHCSLLHQPSCILLGDFSLSPDMDSLESIRFHEEIWTRVLELTTTSQIPVWGNVPFGHRDHNLTLPHGSLTKADSCQASLTFFR